MTAPTLLRYEFDSTGINKDNFVKGEPHTLADKRFRAIAPDHGAFYTRDFKIVEAATKRELLRGVDFVFAELYQSLTLEPHPLRLYSYCHECCCGQSVCRSSRCIWKDQTPVLQHNDW